MADANDALETIVVTGTRSERTLKDVPVRTEVISRTDLDQTHARTVADALRHRPGILLRDIHGKNGQEVSMQGFSADRVLVLLDGRPISASTDSTVDLNQIATVDVERIEIVKGAVSALYGSSAMGGVINVITRDGDTGPAAHLQLSSGSFGKRGVGGATRLDQRHLALGYGTRVNTVSGRIDIDAEDNDGFDLDDSTFEAEGERGTRINLTGSLDYKPDPDSLLGLRMGWYNESLKKDFTTFAPGMGDIEKLDAEEATRFTQTLLGETTLSNEIRLKGYAMRESFDDETRQDAISTLPVDQRRSSTLTTDKAELQADITQGDSLIWTLGTALSADEQSQNQQRVNVGTTQQINELAPGAEHRSAEVYAQADWFVSDRWELVPGLRLQEDSDFGTHLAPRLNLLYLPRPESAWAPRMRAGIGTGYRIPDLKERFFLFDHSINGYIVLGNPALQPEQSLSIQAGVEVGGDDKPLAEISLFWNDIDDLIATDRDAQASAEQQLDVFRYSNVNRARTRGVETRLAWAAISATELSLGYTWLDAQDLETGTPLTRRPEHQLQAAVDWRWPGQRTGVTLKASWQSSETVNAEGTLKSPAYAVADLNLNQPIGQQLKLLAGIDNLGNVHRDPARAGTDFRPDQGRFVYAGFRYDF